MEIAPLEWLLSQVRLGIAGALVTIVGIEGGAPRPVGTQMAVLADGRFEGQISGGCVEPAIAAEVRAVLATGKNAILRFGRGAKAIDIQFPCGGGVDVLVQMVPDPTFLKKAIALNAERCPFVLVQHPKDGTTEVVVGGDCVTGWHDGSFVRHFARKPGYC